MLFSLELLIYNWQIQFYKMFIVLDWTVPIATEAIYKKVTFVTLFEILNLVIYVCHSTRTIDDTKIDQKKIKRLPKR